MVAANPNDRIPSPGPNPVPPVNRPAERVRHYADQSPEGSRKALLLEAVRREIHFREQREKGNGGFATHSTKSECLRCKASIRRRKSLNPNDGSGRNQPIALRMANALQSRPTPRSPTSSD